jgi:drug/metabolite transporter (DMT)-like permease
MKNKLVAGYAFALLATALWSGNFVVARSLSENIHPFSLSFFRWLVAVIVFTPFALKNVVQDWIIIKKHFLYLTITALLGISLFNTLIYFAGRSTAAVNMSLIMLTFPIYILIISAIVFKERIGFQKIIGLGIVFIGVISIVTKGQLLEILNIELNSGDPFMLLAAFIFAIHSILVKSKPKKLSIISLQYMTFLLGLIFLLPFHLWSNARTENIEFTTEMLGGIVYIGIFSSLISFVSWNKAIDKIGASTAGMIYYLLPLFSGLAAWIILREKLMFYHLLSGLLIITGILISNRKFRFKE